MSTHLHTHASPRRPQAQADRAGTRITAALLLLLGFGFTASALVESPDPAQRDRGHLTARAVAVEAAAIADPSAVQSPEVTAAVAQWAFETPAEKRPSPGSYDWEELWLPR